jgi:hypothetical protein
MPMPLANVIHRVVPIFGGTNDPGRTFQVGILSEGFTQDKPNGVAS